eukprot:CAMPEP_0184307958 /NCGR_PEP_ID=MMETSP1049-20130417/16531_1 /TAXON_ID=77928 /ORGANISM="Proteomonas sulcata, Strain CCMP704" /LENGTH=246 /DNA_ID=CAMNT_0026620557 /DNA_START=84 /DNA_END=824 /DNA_ORIENTATION=+
MDEAGVVTDRWPTDVYSATPWMGWDPDADPKRTRAINQRKGEFARHYREDTYHPPVHWGVGGLEGKGNVYKEDRGAKTLEDHNVEHDRWPWNIYRAVPYPGWDETQFDQEAHEDKMPHSDPLDQAKEAKDSEQALSDAGVKVDGLPTDTHHKAYNQVDGMLDTLVNVGEAPKWRKTGYAPQEQPSHFLLTEHPDMAGPQPTEDNELGYEQPPPEPAEEEPYRGFWESIECQDNGCFGKRQGEEEED